MMLFVTYDVDTSDSAGQKRLRKVAKICERHGKMCIRDSSESDDHVSVYLGEDEPVPCPDIGSLANGQDKSNVLAEKRSVEMCIRDSAYTVQYGSVFRSAKR